MNDPIAVTVICTAYNHEKYIADAIESILMQKINFKFELLIHDDASTDETASIIELYEAAHPQKIRAIYQKENVYQQHINIEPTLFQLSRGKYIAICEGDDYWTNPNKLQKQFNLLERHPNISLCVHTARQVDARSNELYSYNRPSKKDKTYSVEEIIEGGGGLFATNSMFFQKDLLTDEFEFMHKAPVSDYAYAIALALKGDVFYMAECMSVYRVNVENSWTSKHLASGETYRKHFREIMIMLQTLNFDTNFKYNKSIQRRLVFNEFTTLVKERNFKRLKEPIFKRARKQLSWRKRLGFLLEQYTPTLFKLLKRQKGLIYWATKEQ